ncbi:MAG TPA: hypothetical protein VG672_30085 [Bryobacteraceae bacterium]|jgi:hypothetical protein|nr:hypothetical protein [Bryobacteraceae bacterium]
MDYVYPGVFLSYFLFFLLTMLTLYMLIRSRKDGYWGKNSEEPKYRMMRDDEGGPDGR